MRFLNDLIIPIGNDDCDAGVVDIYIDVYLNVLADCIFSVLRKLADRCLA